MHYLPLGDGDLGEIERGVRAPDTGLRLADRVWTAIVGERSVTSRRRESEVLRS